MAEAGFTLRPVFGAFLRDVGDNGAAIRVRKIRGRGLATVEARRGHEATLRDRVRARYGIELADGPRRGSAGPTAFTGTAPGAWLGGREASGSAFAAELAHHLQGLAAVADQSDAYGILRLTGTRVPDALAKGVSVDLHPDVFRPGNAAVTSAAHIGFILWRLPDEAGAPIYEVAVPRSFAGSFWDWLAVSAAEFGLRVGFDGPGSFAASDRAAASAGA